MKRLLAAALLLLSGLAPAQVLAATPCDVAFYHAFNGTAYAAINGRAGYYYEGDIISLRPGKYRFEWDDLSLEDVVVAPCEPPKAVKASKPKAVPPRAAPLGLPAKAAAPKIQPKVLSIVAPLVIQPHVRHIPHRPERVG